MEDTMNKLFFILLVLCAAIEIGCGSDSVGPKDPDPPVSTVQVATVETELPDVSPTDTLWRPSDSTYDFIIKPKDRNGAEISPAQLRENNLVPTVSLLISAANASIILKTLPIGEYYHIRIVATGLTSDLSGTTSNFLDDPISTPGNLSKRFPCCSSIIVYIFRK
jgi:hypothetical protein